ncbi:MAG: hypothetical protein HY716_02105 [Planctomycetes bacterium]|nr:hypothetical protein [Planctomycetota bacterium]
MKRRRPNGRDPIECVFDGVLTPREELAVADRVGSDPDAARRLLRAARFEALLDRVVPEAGEAEAAEVRPEFPETAGSWERISSMSSLLLALAGTAAVLLFIINQQPQEIAVPPLQAMARQSPISDTKGVPGKEKGLAVSMEASESRYGAWQRLGQERAEKMAEMPRLTRAAHQALDRGDYPAAVETHQKARRLRSDVEALGAARDRLFPEVVRELLGEMSSDARVRDRATTRMVVEVGSAAIPELERVLGSGDPEPQAHVRKIFRLLNTIGDDGLCRQWAAHAEASSEYGKNNWSARQVCGEPNTPTAGDHPTAWTTKQQAAGLQWIELTYELPVRPVAVRIHETYNPGAVIRVEGRDDRKQWKLLWQGADPTRDCPGWFDVRFCPPSFLTSTLRVTLDTSRVPGWNEIDAVQLVGTPSAGEPER